MHHSSTSTYIPNFIEIEETFRGRTDVRTDISRSRPKKEKQVKTTRVWCFTHVPGRPPPLGDRFEFWIDGSWPIQSPMPNFVTIGSGVSEY